MCRSVLLTKYLSLLLRTIFTIYQSILGNNILICASFVRMSIKFSETRKTFKNHVK